MQEDESDWTGKADQAPAAPLAALQWVVDFVRLDMAQLRVGDWLNLREDLAAFLHAGEGLQAYEDADVRATHAAVRALLDGDAVEVPCLTLTWRAGRPACRVEGPLRDCVLWRVLLLLLDPRVATRLRHCAECQTLFVRRRKQIYCARPCANRVSQRTFRQEHQWTGR